MSLYRLCRNKTGFNVRILLTDDGPFRSTMSTLRLRKLAILHIERQLTAEMVFDNVIAEFATKNQEGLLYGKL